MISKQEFDRMYVGENVVVHCDTEEKAREFLSLADDFGYKWGNGSSYKSETNFEVFGKDTCYNIYRGAYCEIWHYERREYNMVEYTLQEQTKYEQLAKILGVEIGEEFKIRLDSGKVSDTTYKIKRDSVYDSYPSINDGRFSESHVSVKSLIDLEIVKLPWKPKVGDNYYYIDQTSVEGWCELKYNNDNTDKRILSRSKEVYRTEEEVKEAVRKLGWVAE